MDSSLDEWVKVSNFDETELKSAKPISPTSPVFSCSSSCSPDHGSSVQGLYFAGCKFQNKNGAFPLNDCTTDCVYFRA